MTSKGKQDYTSTYLISALEAFRDAANRHGNTNHQIDKIASGLLNLTMALQNLDDRFVAVEEQLDVTKSED